MTSKSDSTEKEFEDVHCLTFDSEFLDHLVVANEFESFVKPSVENDVKDNTIDVSATLRCECLSDPETESLLVSAANSPQKLENLVSQAPTLIPELLQESRLDTGYTNDPHGVPTASDKEYDQVVEP